MIKKSILGIIIGIMLIFTSCSNLTNSDEQVNEDNNYSDNLNLKIKSIELERSGMFTMIDFAFQKYTINENGILYETFYPNMTKTGESFTRFNKGEFEGLVNFLEKNQYQNLKELYESEVLVADVGMGKLIIKSQDNEDKIIEINPYISQGNPDEIKNIIEEINSIISKVKFPNENLEIELLRYQGMQCVNEPWEEWYQKGEIQYFAQPTDEQLIKDYYRITKNITINEINKLNNEVVCEACGVCSDLSYYEIEISKDFTNQMIEEGWEII